MKLIDQIAKNIREKYVLTERAGDIANLFLDKANQLEMPMEPNRMAATLTKLLHEASDDRHFSLRKVTGTEREAPNPLASQKIMQRNNYFFHAAQRLIGNVGYLDLRLFPFDEEAAKVAVGGMAFLANSSALIFDLRQNRGGHPAMIQLLLSYLFDEPQHINTFFYRPTGAEQQMWTMPWLPGRRLGDVPVYVLIGQHSASAAEEFAYDMQQMGRGTLVGETTAGAAHPVEPVMLGDGFILNLPTGRPINPISNRNWEGVGVTPHMAVPAAQALQVAHLHAIEGLLKQAEADDVRFWQWALQSAKAEYEPIIIEGLERFVGQYELYDVVLENGRLYFCSSRGKRPLFPLGGQLFAVDEALRVQFSHESLTILKRDDPETTTYYR